MTAKGIYSRVIILLLINQSYQLNFIQRQIKEALVSSTLSLPPESKVEVADCLRNMIVQIPIKSETVIKMMTDVIDEFKSQPLPKHEDLEISLVNTVAYNLDQSMSLEELNRSMKIIGENELPNKISAATYLAIYLEHGARKIADKLTQYSENLIDDITANTVRIVTKEMDALRERNEGRQIPSD